MSDARSNPPAEVADWSGAGPPRSRLHGDIYFSAEDGLGEARQVFLEGCGLPGAWAGRRLFRVAELGLGVGVNLAALLDLWRRARPAEGRLHIFSLDNDPLSAAEAARALARWPEVAEVAALLTSRWPPRARGFHRIDLPEVSATLDVAVAEAAAALESWDGWADAWFLDGFSPARDPGLWRAKVMALVAARSAPGARVATYTVAGAVREALAEAGFEVARKPGHGRKRARLEARLLGPATVVTPRRAPPRIAIIGAGIAGASLARAFRSLGVKAEVFEAERLGAGASGGPAALVAPRLDAGLGPAAQLFAAAARRAANLYETVAGAVIARGAVQLAAGERDAARFALIAGADIFAPGGMTLLDPEAAAARLGEPCAGALAMADAVVVRPAAILAAWVGPTTTGRIARLERGAGGWRLLTASGSEIGAADVVCVAAGLASADLSRGLPLSAVRGQASLASGIDAPVAASFGGYVLPAPGGALFGATHDRADTATDIRLADDARNLAGVAGVLPVLARRLEGAPRVSWAAVRASTPDYLPLVGEIAEGLHVLTGLGSRGFCLAPLLAEHVAARILAAPSPLAVPLAALLAPGRFAARAARRGRPPPRAQDVAKDFGPGT
jgi:tRNA 5-methylaminomethyl-2-thiouridine biosynthesis bifunctional protein